MTTAQKLKCIADVFSGIYARLDALEKGLMQPPLPLEVAATAPVDPLAPIATPPSQYPPLCHYCGDTIKPSKPGRLVRSDTIFCGLGCADLYHAYWQRQETPRGGRLIQAGDTVSYQSGTHKVTLVFERHARRWLMLDGVSEAVLATDVERPYTRRRN